MKNDRNSILKKAIFFVLNFEILFNCIFFNIKYSRNENYVKFDHEQLFLFEFLILKTFYIVKSSKYKIKKI